MSLEEANYGKIIEINSSCALIFGYQKHSLINQSISNLYPDDFYTHERHTTFTSPATNHQRFMFNHKNGYLVSVKKVARNYNSMAHGLTSLVEIEVIGNVSSCSLLVDQKKKIISATASMLSILDLDLKSFEGESFTYQFFVNDPLKYKPEVEYTIGELLKPDFFHEGMAKNYAFSIRHEEYLGCYLFDIKRINKIKRESRVNQTDVTCCLFQFKVHVDRNNFKYKGSSSFHFHKIDNF